MMGIIALDSAWKDESVEPKYKNLAILLSEKNVSSIDVNEFLLH